MLKNYRRFLEDSGYGLLVFDRDETRMLGQVGFANIRRGRHQDCTLGYGVDGDHEGRGYMFESVAAAIAWAFNERSLHRIEATYDLDNERSARLLQRLGFYIEGKRDRAMLNEGEWLDQMVASLINDE